VSCGSDSQKSEKHFGRRSKSVSSDEDNDIYEIELGRIKETVI
jgi:hypothetical protein